MIGKPRELAAGEVFRAGIWQQNPVFVATLGLCPALAVTNTLANALAMSVATAFVLTGSSLLVSTMRRAIPRSVRITLFVLIIGSFVTTVDYLLAAYLPGTHKKLGAFVALIVANCLILGRQEAFASRNRPGLSLADATGMSAGFALALLMIGAIREILGFGTLAGIALFGGRFEPWSIMVLPPGGFLTVGLVLLVAAALAGRRAAPTDASRGGP